MFNLCAVGSSCVGFSTFLYLFIGVILLIISIQGFIQSSKNWENQKKKKENEKLQQKIDNVKNGDIVKCPKCGSQHISSGNRGYSFIWGSLGSEETLNHCQNCGHRWNPEK